MRLLVVLSPVRYLSQVSDSSTLHPVQLPVLSSPISPRLQLADDSYSEPVVKLPCP